MQGDPSNTRVTDPFSCDAQVSESHQRTEILHTQSHAQRPHSARAVPPAQAARQLASLLSVSRTERVGRSHSDSARVQAMGCLQSVACAGTTEQNSGKIRCSRQREEGARAGWQTNQSHKLHQRLSFVIRLRQSLDGILRGSILFAAVSRLRVAAAELAANASQK
jgi:hypothetical protein